LTSLVLNVLMLGLVLALSNILTSKTGLARTCKVKSRARRRVNKVVKTRMLSFCELDGFDRDSIDEIYLDIRELRAGNHDYLTTTAASQFCIFAAP
jgi:hypothetical protein